MSLTGELIADGTKNKEKLPNSQSDDYFYLSINIEKH